MHETFWTIVTNPAHIGAELTWSVLLDVALIQPIRMLLRRHDRKVHHTDTPATTPALEEVHA